jgi:TRAP-type C4-dicarboxylate transport system substrate-binding protein
VVLTSHLVQPVFFAIGKPFWDKLNAAQKKAVKGAAVNAAAQNNKGRLADEQRVISVLKQKGLRVDVVDLASFRANADKIYADSPLAKKWDKALMAEAMKP